MGRIHELFVKTGYKDWKHATGTTGRLAKHNNSLKHKEAMASWIDFQDNQRKQKSVASSLNTQRKQQISNNRHYLKTIVELLLFCASQEIGLRGHREQESVNKGNILELLQVVARHDHVVKARLTEGPKNAVYTSHNIQNELLHMAANAVRKIICQGVIHAGFFSILADETRDLGKDEQMSFVVRYVGSDGSVHEHFLTA